MNPERYSAIRVVDDENTHSSPVDFSIPFEGVMVSYRPNGGVTRENFTSFLIFSYKVARGSADAQKLFFEWVAQNHQPDLDYILEDFISNKYHYSLSWEERTRVVDAFHRAPHQSEKSISDPRDVEGRIAADFDAVVHEYITNHRNSILENISQDQKGVPFPALAQELQMLIDDANSQRAERDSPYE